MDLAGAHGLLAQLAAQGTLNPEAQGSIPWEPTQQHSSILPSYPNRYRSRVQTAGLRASGFESRGGYDPPVAQTKRRPVMRCQCVGDPTRGSHVSPEVAPSDAGGLVCLPPKSKGDRALPP